MGLLSLCLIAITFLQTTVAAPAVAVRSPGNSVVVLALFCMFYSHCGRHRHRAARPEGFRVYVSTRLCCIMTNKTCGVDVIEEPNSDVEKRAQKAFACML